MRAQGPQDITASFNRTLDRILDGTYTRVPSETGLDQQTIDALNSLAAQPDKTPSDIEACRIEFGRQLDGTHAEEDDAEVLRLLLGQ